MTKEEKQLLLTDLCARLPYGVKIHKVLYGATTLNERNIESFRKGFDDMLIPYLRPMSSMTEEEKKELRDKNILIAISTSGTVETTIDGFDWLNAHHFDYRGLIPKGLAIEVTEENNPYEN